jgi:hypothetical protein
MLDRLVDCLYNHDGDVDISAIDQCLEDLEQTGAAREDFDVEQGLKQFHERFDEAFENHPEPEVVTHSKKRRPLARIAIIAAAVLCMFAITAQASGLDIIGTIARWTSEQFSFVKEGEVKDERQEDAPYSSLQDALDDCGIMEQLSPTRFPEGTEFLSVLVKKVRADVAFSASYALSGQTFYISVQSVAGVPYSKVEINNPDLEIYVAGGIEHHIMTDVKQRKVTWCNGAWECSIAGDISRHDLTLMIDSIYK